MKIKNKKPFQVLDERWSMWVPAGKTLTVEISPDGKDDHFAVIADDVTGPDVFQCSGYNEKSFFRVSGFSGELDILN